MQKRRYGQLCPVGYALDIVGERWTLLIVRDLLYGHRRYSDLLRGLPGIGTNLLSTRLKELERSGLLRKRTLPPPMASAVYELTERGRALGPVIGSLAAWGTELLDSISDSDYLGVMPMLGSLTLLFRPSEPPVTITAEFQTDEEVFFTQIEASEISVSQGEAAEPDVVMSTDTKTLLGLLGHPDTVSGAINGQQVKIKKGSLGEIQALLGCFRSVDSAAANEKGRL